ncbi:MAG: DUF4198 domain-containing protein [Rhodobacteraceae bacterium]|nr:DUF4198 domain-containing protein [Paracoccaceae bacterium]
MSLRSGLSACLLLVALSPAALAHEFWIAPTEYQVTPDTPVTADLRNGETFSGMALGYFEGRTARYEVLAGGQLTAVAARMGDVPALQLPGLPEGLAVIVHETTPSTLAYTQWEKFAAFAAHKDFPDIRARHLARGLPETGFRESYTRHAKSLIAVGAGAGSDRQFGLAQEFVALGNPYTDPPEEGLTVRLFYGDAPRSDAQVEVFERAPGGDVAVTLMRTDDAGQVRVPVRPGHEYLLDAVVLRPAPDGGEAVWETLWAALTFAVP